MYHNLEFTVNEEKELLEFLYENIKKPKKEVKNYLIHEKVFVNNRIITKHNYLLKKNMKVIINLTKEIFNIIYEDKDIIIVDKPENLLCVATEKEKEETLYHLVSKYIKKKNQSSKIFIVHRLDKETSGIVIFAKNETIKEVFQNNWDSLVIKRNYVAIVNGKTNKDSGTIKSYLKENEQHMVYSSKDGKLAITDYKTIKSNNNYTWLNIEIQTGRKNQIRVHMKDLGNIIRGDKKYGDKSVQKRMYLHASNLIFTHPVTKKVMDIKSIIPKEFELR